MINFILLQISSFAQSCLTLCDPMNRSTPGLPVHPPPGDLPDPGIKPGSPALQADSLLPELQGSPSGGTVFQGGVDKN